MVKILAALFLFPLAASAASPDAPKRKSGLWSITVSYADMRPMTFQQCVDQKTDDLMKPDPQAEKSDCSKNVMRREGAAVVGESVCKINGSTATTRAVFTGSFDSAYKVDISSSYQPPYEGMRESAGKIDAKWTGPCKAGQKPGDVMIQGMPGMDERMKGAPKKR